MERRLKIGIAGCGIGGLALGAILARHGHHAQIFDRFAAPEPVGSGLVVQPVGLKVLQALGADGVALAMGAKISHMHGVDAKSGKTALNVSYGAGFGLAMHRASLFDALFQVALNAGCQITPSTLITGAEGGHFLTETGQYPGPFDLLVDASGARSLLSPLKAKPLTYGALWASVDWPAGSPLSPTMLNQRYYAASKMAGVLPIGTLPNDPTPKAAIFWSLKVSDFPSWQAQPFEKWQAEAAALWPEFAPFIARLSCHEDLTMARYRHGTLKRKTSDGFAYIGDAAHCASPQLGQGANMALLDAYALGTALLAHPVPEALRRYDKARRRHIATYQAMSRFLTPLYQSDSTLLPWLRNHLLAPLGEWPFAPILTRIGAGNAVRPVLGEGLAFR